MKIRCKGYIEFCSRAEEDLWKEELLGQISDGAYESLDNSHWNYWADLPTRVNTSLASSRVVNGKYKNEFTFAEDLLDIDMVVERMLKAVQKTQPEATKEDLEKMLDDISNACELPVSECEKVVKEERRKESRVGGQRQVVSMEKIEKTLCTFNIKGDKNGDIILDNVLVSEVTKKNTQTNKIKKEKDK